MIGNGNMLILLKYTICEKIARFTYPLNGGVSFQAALNETRQLEIAQFHPYVRFLDIMYTAPLDPTTIVFPFYIFLRKKSGRWFLGSATRDQPVTNPWFSRDNPWFPLKNLGFSGKPWFSLTHDQPVIYPWQPVIFRPENHGLKVTLANSPKWYFEGKVRQMKEWFSDTCNLVLPNT